MGLQEDEGDMGEVVLDLTGQGLRMLEKAPANKTYATAIVLDNNSLQNLSNLDSYGELQRISIANNQIVRMYWFARMYSLRILNLPNNFIIQIEGVRELHHLVHLNLSGNNIKSFDGLSHNQQLEHLNLSGNAIEKICDLSMLKKLKEVFLHRNRIQSLQRCNKFLPASLVILTLSDNAIDDLNELNHLCHLNNLEQFTILNNPCLEPLTTVDEDGLPMEAVVDFDYRPFVINWCLNLKVLDGYKVTPKESLKAEWLYSQGRGRGFQVGEHGALVQYLSGICLAGGGWGGAELPDDEEKLVKILSLAKQHQKDLRNTATFDTRACVDDHVQLAEIYGTPITNRRFFRKSTTPAPLAAKKKKLVGERGGRCGKGDLSRSYHVELSSTLYGGDLSTPDRSADLMTQSLDPSLLNHFTQRPNDGDMSTSFEHLGTQSSNASIEQWNRRNLTNRGAKNSMGPITQNRKYCAPIGRTAQIDASAGRLVDISTSGQGLMESSEFVPAPESMMSPEFQTTAWNDRKVSARGCPPSSKKVPNMRSHASSAKTTYSVDTSSRDLPSRYSPKAMPRHSVRSNRINDAPKAYPSKVSSSKKYANDQDSENSDSEISVSKLESIKCIAADKKLKSRCDKPTDKPNRKASSSKPYHKTSSEDKAATCIQKYWKKYKSRHKRSSNPSGKQDDEKIKLQQQVRYLSEKLLIAEKTIERERRLRHLQIDAIKTLWREIKKMQTGSSLKKEGSATTPSTPITPVTPLDKASTNSRSKLLYSQENVQDLADFCKSLQTQVVDLQSSLKMVTQVMNSFSSMPTSRHLHMMYSMAGTEKNVDLHESVQSDSLHDDIKAMDSGPSGPVRPSTLPVTNLTKPQDQS